MHTSTCKSRNINNPKNSGFTKEKNIYLKKRSMYNMIHANQQDIHWKQYSLFSVYQVDEHEKYKS